MQDDVERPSSVGAQADNNKLEEEATNDKDTVKTDKRSVSYKQNEKLYTAEGILNPKLKKAEKKRRKKTNKLDAMDDDDDEDYDFKVDYSKNASSMDVEDEDIEEDNPITGDEAPSATA
ncbi:unnamed protein product [Rhodiola kirilowii]